MNDAREAETGVADVRETAEKSEENFTVVEQTSLQNEDKPAGKKGKYRDRGRRRRGQKSTDKALVPAQVSAPAVREENVPVKAEMHPVPVATDEAPKSAKKGGWWNRLMG